MRRIVVSAFVSLDGVMQAPGGPEEDTSGGFRHGGWTVKLFDEALGASVGEIFATPFDLLLGRKTYDIFAAHWPRLASETPPAGIDEGEVSLARIFDGATKHVATHRPETLTWRNSEALGRDVVARLRQLKERKGPVLLVQGSSDLIQTLLADDLIDEFRLFIFPLVLGKGKRLFGEGTVPGAFRLVESTTSPTGVLVATYQRAGAVQTGSFALDTPTDAGA
ncbi:MAG: dihydrofolate reductase family protein [Hydrogenophaga sp.]|jgi:dihydrofolate reductase|uniref:dihydrofolate reductase family protein n=1 Tax=Hydrogenophaga sp. TaxID=1904254 RepID=UPI00260E1D88|nr:dihydrofolate reductase family protein [Hydrogenophaga sp.]MCV0439589.1 dihydrofolate reductase family protein [Hydrogenophaga sp.]